MPFKIIRSDITQVEADAVVNTANPYPGYGGGTDKAIYEAAGKEWLLAARRKIGKIDVGQAVWTPAFLLPAKYIIHTVGPEWEGGGHHERENLKSCYMESMRLAESLGCNSIAFPLISTGIYEFPKDEAIQTALSAFSEFLMTSEMLVILVVFGRESYRLSKKIVTDVDAYIDDHYVEDAVRYEYYDETCSRTDEPLMYCASAQNNK